MHDAWARAVAQKLFDAAARQSFTRQVAASHLVSSSRPPVIYFRSQSYSFMWLTPFSTTWVVRTQRNSTCHSASSYKISLKSDNRLMSYGQKSDFQDGGHRHLEFQKFQFLVTWLSSGSISNVVYQISSKSDDFSLRYGDFTIYKMAAVRHLGF